jgi:hypothetical protein
MLLTIFFGNVSSLRNYALFRGVFTLLIVACRYWLYKHHTGCDHTRPVDSISDVEAALGNTCSIDAF